MTDRSTDAWYPTAAYLYVLHLDDLALAWEYLRRHPDYRLDWLRHHQPRAAHAWGLRLLEDPALDARDAHPAWFPDHDGVLQFYPDDDPQPESDAFEFWRIPGRKHVIHDGKRMVLTARWPGCCVRLALAPTLANGMAYLYAIRASTASCASHRTFTAELGKLVTVDAASVPAAAARSRPTPAALLELHTLQALDATLAGASMREIAQGLFGVEAVAAGWYADGGLRSRVRRLVRRGQSLMRGGYRRLAQID